MEEVVRIENRWYIHAGSSLVDQRTLVLKDGEMFGAFNPHGDLEAFAVKAHGLFVEGMRFLSRLETRLNGRRPLLLSSAIALDNSHFSADLTNPDITVDDRPTLPYGAVHLRRIRRLQSSACEDRLLLSSFDRDCGEIVLGLTFDGDFADIFEVRGMHRERRGRRLEPHVLDGRAVRLGYEGLDGIIRLATIEFDPPPTLLTVSHARTAVRLGVGEQCEIRMTTRCEVVRPGPVPAQPRRAAPEPTLATCRITTSSQALSQWLTRSAADVAMLTTHMDTGPYPFAGIPWYSCPFGRDGIITAMQMLWYDASLARGVLAFMARTQASVVDAARDAEPGKVFHEWRNDEMSNLGEVPFGRYYGTVDATPLFIMLAGAYERTTGDREFIRELWPNIERALQWIDQYGDGDRDGFVEYRQKATDGLGNQGWKDSQDSVFHADGRLAEPPIALCEVQGYVYAAKVAAATLARIVDQYEYAEELERQARTLRARFHEFFWSDSLRMYALALDRHKEPCLVRASNAGHTLWTGIADPEAAPRLVRSLMSKAMFSRWGIRTVAEGEARYNPMSYHNGSVWPHDNAIIAAGLARYGFRSESRALLAAWMDAAQHLDLQRLPELICGFPREPGSGPTLYPVACNPQAWAAGSVFMMLQACLGLDIDASKRLVRVSRPVLPRRVPDVLLTNLRVGDGSVDLLFHREREDVGVLVRRREGNIRVQVDK